MSPSPEANSLCLAHFAEVRRHLNLRATKSLKRFGIGPKQALLVRELAERKRCSLADLSRATLTDPAATGKAVESMIQRGLIRAYPHPTDRRCRQVALTAAGQRLFRHVHKIWHDVAGDLVSVLGHEDRKHLSHLLEKVAASLRPSA